MAAELVEGACELTDWIADKHGDAIHDKIVDTSRKYRGNKPRVPKANSKTQPPQNQQSGQGIDNSAPKDSSQQQQRRGSEAVSATASRAPHRHRNSLPSPEREDKNNAYAYRGPREDSLERESQRSARILEDYENEHDDPRRDPYQSLGREAIPPAAAGAAIYAASNRNPPPPPRDTGRRRQSTRETTNTNKKADMSYGNGYHDRPRSQPPPNSRYYYDDDEYGSDYDERTGNRYRDSGRGYRDNAVDRDGDGGEPYREYVETERYRGPARGFQSQFRGPEGGYGPPSGAAAGALAPYNRRSSRTEVSSRRSKSRGRRDSRSRSRSISGSRSRSRGSQAKHKLEEWFDPSPKGIGFGIAGAVVGGLAGKKLGGGQRGEHHQRDMLLGAVIGGLAANAAENKWREYRHPDERRDGRREAYEYDDGGRRPRSSVR